MERKDFDYAIRKIKHIHPRLEEKLWMQMQDEPITGGLKVERKIRDLIGTVKDLSSNSIKYWMLKGWSETEAEEKRTKPCRKGTGGFSKETFIKKGYTEDEAIFKIRSSRKLNLEYWINLGFTEDEAKEKLSEFQQQNAKINVEKHSHRKDKSPCQIGYWISKGYNNHEAKQKLKERQHTRDLDKYIKYLGKEAGIAKYLSFIEDPIKISILNSVSNLDETKISSEYKRQLEIYKSSCFQASKASLWYFIPLYLFLKEKCNMLESSLFLGYWGGTEYKIFYSLKNYYRYDFTILTDKVIFEYNGSPFHPDENNKDGWVHPSLNLNADEMLVIKKNRDLVARNQGFEVIDIDGWKTKEERLVGILYYLKKYHNIDEKTYKNFARGKYKNEFTIKTE